MNTSKISFNSLRSLVILSATVCVTLGAHAAEKLSPLDERNYYRAEAIVEGQVNGARPKTEVVVVKALPSLVKQEIRQDPHCNAFDGKIDNETFDGDPIFAYKTELPERKTEFWIVPCFIEGRYIQFKVLSIFDNNSEGMTVIHHTVSVPSVFGGRVRMLAEKYLMARATGILIEDGNGGVVQVVWGDGYQQTADTYRLIFDSNNARPVISLESSIIMYDRAEKPEYQLLFRNLRTKISDM